MNEKNKVGSVQDKATPENIPTPEAQPPLDMDVADVGVITADQVKEVVVTTHDGETRLMNITEARKVINTLPVLTADMFEQGNAGTSESGLTYDETKSDVNGTLRIRLKELLYVGMGISIELTNKTYLAHFTMYDDNGLSTGETTDWLSLFSKKPQYIGIVVTKSNTSPITVADFDSIGFVIKHHLGTVTPSTTEQATGETWYGKPVYVRMIKGTIPSVMPPYSSLELMGIGTVDRILSISGYFSYNGAPGNKWLVRPDSFLTGAYQNFVWSLSSDLLRASYNISVKYTKP